MSYSRPLSEIFFWPLVIGTASMLGLISALIGDGIRDVVSWVLLGIPIVIALYFSCIR